MIRPLTVSARVQWIALLVLVAVAIFSAYLFGVRSTAPVPELIAPAAAQSQPDGSVVAERRPQASPGKAPHQLPKGSTEERRASIKLKPAAPPVADASGVLECPPVSVDLSLVREQDGGRRIVASSQDGKVVSALDVPIETGLIQERRPWSAGVSYGEQSPGVWVERDLGRIRAGAELVRDQAGAVQGRVRVGWVW